MKTDLFRKSSIERVLSPEQLNNYIRVSNPSIWIVLLAVFVLFTSIASWSITGVIPTIVTAKGVVENGKLVCYIPEISAAGIVEGTEAAIIGKEVSVKVENVSDFPLAASEIEQTIATPYIAHTLIKSEWSKKVVLSADDAIEENKIYDINIITDEIHPIEFFFN